MCFQETSTSYRWDSSDVCIETKKITFELQQYQSQSQNWKEHQNLLGITVSVYEIMIKHMEKESERVNEAVIEGEEKVKKLEVAGGDKQKAEDRYQNLMARSLYQRQSFLKISLKSIHKFSSNMLTDRQTAH